MFLVDANVLLHAYHPRSDDHDVCRRWLEDAFSGSVPVHLAWISILAFLRISTSARVFERPLGMAEARAIVASWLAAPAVSVLESGERYWEVLSKLLVNSQVSGALVTDAALAALALEHGLTVCTTDRDFTRFAGLRVLNPTEG